MRRMSRREQRPAIKRKPPRIGSGAVCNNTRRQAAAAPRQIKSPSALGELEAATRFGAAVFLSLHHARVAGEETAAFEHAAQIGLAGVHMQALDSPEANPLEEGQQLTLAFGK